MRAATAVSLSYANARARLAPRENPLLRFPVRVCAAAAVRLEGCLF